MTFVHAAMHRTQDSALLLRHRDEPLRLTTGEGKQARVFLSGAAEPADGVFLDGLTVIQANGLEEAEAVADRDPPITSGTVASSLHPPTVSEGSLSLTPKLSDSTGALR